MGTFFEIQCILRVGCKCKVQTVAADVTKYSVNCSLHLPSAVNTIAEIASTNEYILDNNDFPGAWDPNFCLHIKCVLLSGFPVIWKLRKLIWSGKVGEFC